MAPQTRLEVEHTMNYPAASGRGIEKLDEMASIVKIPFCEQVEAGRLPIIEG
jgi:hypothetical protein